MGGAPALTRGLDPLELGAHVGVRPPVTEVVQAEGEDVFETLDDKKKVQV